MCRGIVTENSPPPCLSAGSRSEKALVAGLGREVRASTRKVKAITEERCGHRFSASAISAINKGLEEGLARFAERELDEAYPYSSWMPATSESEKRR